MDPEEHDELGFQTQSNRRNRKVDPKKSVRFPVAQMRSLGDALKADKVLSSVELVKVDHEFGEARMKESLIPAFLTLCSRVEREWLVFKEERKEGRDMEKQLDKYNRLTKMLVREGYDKMTVPATARDVQPKDIKLGRPEQIGSYSFLVHDKTIFVPGFPSVYQDPKVPHVAPLSTATTATWDKSDPHRATFDYPFDPLLVAAHEIKPDFNIDDYDIVTGRNNLCKLFGWLLGSKEAWRIDLEQMKNQRKTLFFARNDPPVVMSDSDAAAIEFEKICGQNDDDSSFHVLTAIELHGGVPGSRPLKILITCEVDAALPPGVQPITITKRGVTKPPVTTLPFIDPAIVAAAPPKVNTTVAEAAALGDPAIVTTPPAGSSTPSAAQPATEQVEIPKLDMEQRKKDRAAATDVPKIHEKCEARVKRTNQPLQVGMVELKSIFEANWIKENNDRLVKHWFQCWIAGVSLLAVGIKQSQPDGQIRLIESHSFRPGPLQRNPALPPEIPGFELDDFFFTHVYWPGIDKKTTPWKDLRDKLARARLETLHRLYLALQDIRRKVDRTAGKTKRLSLVGHPEKAEAHVFKPANSYDRWVIPPWYEQYYAEKNKVILSDSPLFAITAADEPTGEASQPASSS